MGRPSLYNFNQKFSTDCLAFLIFSNFLTRWIKIYSRDTVFYVDQWDLQPKHRLDLSYYCNLWMRIWKYENGKYSLVVYWTKIQRRDVKRAVTCPKLRRQMGKKCSRWIGWWIINGCLHFCSDSRFAVWPHMSITASCRRPLILLPITWSFFSCWHKIITL